MYTTHQIAIIIKATFELYLELGCDANTDQIATRINEYDSEYLKVCMDRNVHSNDLETPFRTLRGMSIKAVRLDHAANGMIFDSDCTSLSDAIDKVNRTRVVLHSLNVMLNGPLQLKHVKLLKGKQKMQYNNTYATTGAQSCQLSLRKRVSNTITDDQTVYKASVNIVKSRFQNDDGSMNWIWMLVEYGNYLGTIGVDVNIKRLNTFKRYSNYKLTDPQFRPTFKMWVDSVLDSIVEVVDPVHPSEPSIDAEYKSLVEEFKNLITVNGVVRWDLVAASYAVYTGRDQVQPVTVERYSKYRASDTRFISTFRDYISHVTLASKL